MNIKTKKYTYSPDVTSTLYTDKIGIYKFEADIFESGNGKLVGELSGNIKRVNVISQSDSTLEDWIDDATEMSEFYSNLVKFLKNVKRTHKK